ncbi:hypothetical protein [Rivibacter subsaxonicus]|uniref:DUF2946 domain-containing protein n=1 Tax=Rivibacter subsaxonicus TaxID=457575 RepID=A0A4Q7W0C5_9BURK|nr:hypothetical protein [Rivibacter subsaxonicus]RZU02540.1 hypothetical protein EV670_0568 [Rivibacter subsaxonicus]
MHLLRRRPSLPLALLLAWALLGAQLLGGWHRIAHAPQGLPATLVQAVPGSAEFADPGSALGHTRGSADCGLFDQLLVAAALVSSAPPASPVLVPAFDTLPALGSDVLATAWQRPAARAPPLGHSA